MKTAALLLALAAAGCAYAPPKGVDATAPAFQTDLASCRETVPAAVNQQNAKTGFAWFTSPFRRWSQIRTGIGACMAEKGHRAPAQPA